MQLKDDLIRMLDLIKIGSDLRATISTIEELAGMNALDWQPKYPLDLFAVISMNPNQD